MKLSAIGPFFSEEREAYTGEGWIVGIIYKYDPGEPVGAVRGHYTFKTQDEALAHYYSVNGSSQ